MFVGPLAQGSSQHAVVTVGRAWKSSTNFWRHGCPRLTEVWGKGGSYEFLSRHHGPQISFYQSTTHMESRYFSRINARSLEMLEEGSWNHRFKVFDDDAPSKTSWILAMMSKTSVCRGEYNSSQQLTPRAFICSLY